MRDLSRSGVDWAVRGFVRHSAVAFGYRCSWNVDNGTTDEGRNRCSIPSVAGFGLMSVFLVARP